MVFILARSISCKPSALWIPFQSSSHYVKSLSKYLPCALSCCTSNLLLRVVCALSPPQAGVKAQCVKSAGVVKLSASCSILLPFVWKSTRRETENGVEKQKGCSQVRLEKREKVNEAVEMSELPIEVWKSPEVLVLFFFFSLLFLLPPALSSETFHTSIQAVVAATVGEENLEAVPEKKRKRWG